MCASLAEDRYGTVQRDIPRILEALLAFLIDLDAYQNELTAAAPNATEPGSERKREELSKANDVVIGLAEGTTDFSPLNVREFYIDEFDEAIRNGVVRVAQTFGDKLNAFKLSPRAARKLQGFADYRF